MEMNESAAVRGQYRTTEKLNIRTAIHSRYSTNHIFTLQNGAAQLKLFFTRVERYDYEDALEVTNLEDMADYIATLEGMSALGCLPRETVLSVLETYTVGGVLHVPKEYGMFAAD